MLALHALRASGARGGATITAVELKAGPLPVALTIISGEQVTPTAR